MQQQEINGFLQRQLKSVKQLKNGWFITNILHVHETSNTPLTEADKAFQKKLLLKNREANKAFQLSPHHLSQTCSMLFIHILTLKQNLTVL